MGTNLRGNNVSSAVPATGQVLTWDGSQWVAQTPSGGGASPSGQTITANESTQSTTYVDLATVGPAVTVTVGDSGLLLVSFGFTLGDTSYTASGWMGLDFSGANTIAPIDDDSVQLTYVSNYSNIWNAGSRQRVIGGLNPGLTTITAKYRTNGGFPNIAHFLRRDLVVTPL